MNEDAMLRCDDCGEPVRPFRFYREVSGWEQVRDDAFRRALPYARECVRALEQWRKEGRYDS